MSLKDILNYPLLRGERAERLAVPLVEKPALAMAVATAAFSGLAVMGPWTTLGISLAVGAVLATTLAQRQEEYRCDRHAIKMTRNPAAGREVLVIKQIDIGLSPTARPSLLINCLLSHPCIANRAREMSYFDNQLAQNSQNRLTRSKITFFLNPVDSDD